MSIVNKIFDFIYSIMIILAKILLVVMVVVVSAAVFFRFVLNSGIKWSDEVALITMVWFTFIGLAIGVRRSLHISIEIIASVLPQRVNMFLDKFINIVCAFLGVVMVIYGIKLVEFTMESTLPATGLPSAILYVIVPISAVFVSYYSLVKLFGLEETINNDNQNMPEGGKSNA